MHMSGSIPYNHGRRQSVHASRSYHKVIGWNQIRPTSSVGNYVWPISYAGVSPYQPSQPSTLTLYGTDLLACTDWRPLVIRYVIT
jgi:hypothetical protein